MPIDPRIPLGVQGPQIDSPLVALSQIAQLQALRGQAEERQAQAAVRQTAAEEAAAKRERQWQIDAALDAAYSGPPDPKTGRRTLDRTKLYGHLPGHLQYQVDQELDEDEKKGLDFQTARLNRDTTQLELDTKRRAWFGSQLRTVRASNYDPLLFGVEVRAAQRAGALDDETAAQLLSITDPAQIKARIDSYIALAEGAAAKPPQLVTHVAKTGPYAGQTVQEFVPPVTGEQYIEPPKVATPAAPANLQQKEVLLDGKPALVNYNPDTGTSHYQGQDVSARVRPMPQAPNPLVDEIRRLTIANLERGGNWTPGQLASFEKLTTDYDASPLVRAADRTVVLKDAVQQIRKDPANPVNQMALAYGFIQIADTYQSAVREGEIGNIAALATRLEQLTIEANRIYNTGAFMPAGLAQQIATTSEQMIKAVEAGREQKERQFRSRATVSGIGEMWDQYVAGFASQREEASPSSAGALPRVRPPTGAGGARRPPGPNPFAGKK